MSTNTPNWGNMLESYLDGELRGADLAAFESELANDPDLRAAVELNHRIGRSLRRAFAPPAAIEIPAPETTAALNLPPAAHAAEIATTARPKNVLRQFALYAAAAIVAIVGAVGLNIWSENRTPDPVDTSPDATYARIVQAGFTPQWKCENDEEFQKAVADRLGQPLVLASGLPGVDVLGWAYSGNGYDSAPLTGRVMILLTNAQGKEVLVFIDQKKNDTNALTVRHKSGLHLFRREICDLVAYEVTPLPESRIVQNLYEPSR